jgi:large conductance mechanosensitive channel
MSIIKEFKEFAMRGNVIDLAVGVVIGGAFGAIVSSLVADILMPLIGIITGGVDFSGLSVDVGEAKLSYGKFIQALISSIIIAFAIFVMIKGLNTLSKKKEVEEAIAPPPAPTKEEELLTEIRDLLKK